MQLDSPASRARFRTSHKPDPKWTPVLTVTHMMSARDAAMALWESDNLYDIHDCIEIITEEVDSIRSSIEKQRRSMDGISYWKLVDSLTKREAAIERYLREMEEKIPVSTEEEPLYEIQEKAKALAAKLKREFDGKLAEVVNQWTTLIWPSMTLEEKM